MGLTHHSLDELDTQGIELALSDEQSHLLVESASWTCGPLEAAATAYFPMAVWAVRFADLQVEVTPKEKLRANPPTIHARLFQGPGLPPRDCSRGGVRRVVASNGALADHFRRAGAEARLLQGYRTEQDALFTVRGRIAFEEQLRRRSGWAIPIEVRYDEFTTDIAENQILLSALHVMLGVPRLRSEVRRGLLHLTHRLSEVTRLTPGQHSRLAADQTQRALPLSARSCRDHPESLLNEVHAVWRRHVELRRCHVEGL